MAYYFRENEERGEKWKIHFVVSLQNPSFHLTYVWVKWKSSYYIFNLKE